MEKTWLWVLAGIALLAFGLNTLGFCRKVLPVSQPTGHLTRCFNVPDGETYRAVCEP